MNMRLPSARIEVSLVVLAAAACTEPPTSLPPAAPLALESSTLFSGAEGVLVSEAFGSIELVALRDSLGEIPRRWSNFEVRFDGNTTDSWRVSGDRIGFRVPPSYSGTYTVAIRTPTYATRAVQARVIGATPGYGPVLLCAAGFYDGSDFVPLGPEELLLSADCVRTGSVRLIPGTMLQLSSLVNPDEWIDELWFEWLEGRDRFRSMWAAGPSVRPQHAVVERYPDTAEDRSSTWIWRFGSHPGPVEPIECLPPDVGWGWGVEYTAAEIVPGVCLSVTLGGDFYLNGSELVADALPIGLSGIYPSFRVASNGTAVLRNVELVSSRQGTSRAWAVFQPGEGVAYTVSDYLFVKDVAFSPSGDSMFVTAIVNIDEDEHLVLDLREVEAGRLLKRVELGCPEPRGRCAFNAAAIARDAVHLWILRWAAVDDDWQLRVELRDPVDLSVLRSVAVPDHLAFTHPMVPVGFDPVLVPDATGRRAYIWSVYPADLASGYPAAGYLMDLY